jgi:hypothetical protein
MTPHGSLTPADAPLIEAEILFTDLALRQIVAYVESTLRNA